MNNDAGDGCGCGPDGLFESLDCLCGQLPQLIGWQPFEVPNVRWRLDIIASAWRLGGSSSSCPWPSPPPWPCPAYVALAPTVSCSTPSLSSAGGSGSSSVSGLSSGGTTSEAAGARQGVGDGEEKALLAAMRHTACNIIFITDRQSVIDGWKRNVWRAA